jgi:hypothetical protein
MTQDSFNASLWPYSLFAGVPLLILALRNRKKYIAVAATPLFAPYVNFSSYAVLLFAFIPYEAGFILMIVMSWLVLRY